MDKAPDAFRTISEVAEDLDLPQHVLRFWETRFNQIRPMKRGGGRRYYRPDDVELLRGIRHLLYGEGYTIKGVQRILKEQGVRFVMEIWRHPGMPIPNERASLDRSPRVNRASEGEVAVADHQDALYFDYEEAGGYDAGEAGLGQELETAQPGPELAVQHDPLPHGILPDDAPQRGGFRFMDRFRSGSADVHSGPHGSLSREDIRRLQSTLFELLECKRLLDQTR